MSISFNLRSYEIILKGLYQLALMQDVNDPDYEATKNLIYKVEDMLETKRSAR